MNQRRILRIGAVVAAVGIVGWLGDTALAVRAERTIARSVETTTHLPEPPNVYIGGTPYAAALITGNVPTLTARALDVEVPGFGSVNATTEVFNLTLTREQVLTGELRDVPARVISRAIAIDGVGLGAKLGITDLSISHPYNIAPGGGTAAEAMLTGTPPGETHPVSVLVRLRITGTTISITPSELLDAPSSVTPEDVFPHFALTIDSTDLPLPSQASHIYARGGTIVIEAEERNVTIDTEDLSPLGEQHQDTADEVNNGHERATTMEHHD